MRKSRLFVFILLGGLLYLSPLSSCWANPHSTLPLKKLGASFQSALGTFDRAALQRGYKVYKEVCAACHSLKLLRYGSLIGIGLTPEEIKVLAADFKVPDTDDEGQPKERTATQADHFVKPYVNDKQARSVNNGSLPPDLSAIVKARVGGADYIYSLLTSYENPPESVQLGPNMHWNLYFPGYQIAMTPPLVTDGQVTYEDGTIATIDQMAKDVTTFLAWASEPEMEQRRHQGVKVLFYLLIFTVILYFTKRKIWKDVS